MLAPSREVIVGIRAALLLDRLYDDERFPPILLGAEEPKSASEGKRAAGSQLVTSTSSSRRGRGNI